jgi:hypothetical protein
MQDRSLDLPQDVLQLLATRAWCLIPDPTKLISMILLPSHAHMDQDALGKFDIVVQTANSSFQFPWQGDKFLLLVFMDRGHSWEALIRLNM